MTGPGFGEFGIRRATVRSDAMKTHAAVSDGRGRGAEERGIRPGWAVRGSAAAVARGRCMQLRRAPAGRHGRRPARAQAGGRRAVGPGVPAQGIRCSSRAARSCLRRRRPAASGRTALTAQRDVRSNVHSARVVPPPAPGRASPPAAAGRAAGRPAQAAGRSHVSVEALPANILMTPAVSAPTRQAGEVGRTWRAF